MLRSEHLSLKHRKFREECYKSLKTIINFTMFCFFISATDLDSSGVSSKSLLSDKNIKSPALLWQKYRSTLSPLNIFKLLLVRAVFVIYVLVAVFFLTWFMVLLFLMLLLLLISLVWMLVMVTSCCCYFSRMLNCLIQRNITPFTICSELRL